MLDALCLPEGGGGFEATRIGVIFEGRGEEEEGFAHGETDRGIVHLPPSIDVHNALESR